MDGIMPSRLESIPHPSFPKLVKYIQLEQAVQDAKYAKIGGREYTTANKIKQETGCIKNFDFSHSMRC